MRIGAEPPPESSRAQERCDQRRDRSRSNVPAERKYGYCHGSRHDSDLRFSHQGRPGRGRLDRRSEKSRGRTRKQILIHNLNARGNTSIRYFRRQHARGPRDRYRCALHCETTSGWIVRLDEAMAVHDTVHDGNNTVRMRNRNKDPRSKLHTGPNTIDQFYFYYYFADLPILDFDF